MFLFMIPCSPLSIPISRTAGFFWIIDPCRVTLWFSFIYFCPLICFLEISLTLSSNLLNLYFTSHALNSESSSCHLLLFCSILFINWIQCLLISLWRYYQYFLYNYQASLLALGKESACSAGDSGDPGVRNIPWRRKWLPSSILTWKIPWIEEPGSVQSKGSDMAEHTDLFILCFDGCLLRHRLFSSCVKQGLLSSFGAQASPSAGFSCGAQPLGHMGFSSCSSRAHVLELDSRA